MENELEKVKEKGPIFALSFWRSNNFSMKPQTKRLRFY